MADLPLRFSSSYHSLIYANVYYVHSGNGRNEETQSVCLNIWDLRALTNSESQRELLKLISDPGEWNKVHNKQPYEIHPLLSIGRLRCGLDEISHTVEWWSRAWVFDNISSDEKIIRPLGFDTSKQEKK